MRRVLAVLALSLVAAACTPDVVPDPEATGTATTGPTGFDDLAAALFDEPPAGFVAVPEETRGLSLDDVAGGGDDPEAERARLERNGFLRGFIRTWSSDDDSESVVYAFVYEFRTPAGAEADAAQGIREAKAGGDEIFDVPGIGGATGITKRPPPGSEGDDSTFHAVVLVRGNRYFLVAIGGPTDHPRDAAVELARRMAAQAAA